MSATYLAKIEAREKARIEDYNRKLAMLESSFGNINSRENDNKRNGKNNPLTAVERWKADKLKAWKASMFNSNMTEEDYKYFLAIAVQEVDAEYTCLADLVYELREIRSELSKLNSGSK